MIETIETSQVSEPLLRSVMPELDSLRGIAILGVVFLHGFFWPYAGFHFSRTARVFLNLTQPGWLGVNLFFVLSGFLITGILLDSKTRLDYYRRFYTRRALRILPAYYSLLALLGILGQAGTAYLSLGFIYLANVTVFFGVAQAYGPLWSLAVEEHFYLFWPTVVHRLSRRGLGVLALGICIVVPILRGASFSLGHTTGLGDYTWFVVDGLASGALVALFLRSNITRSNVTRACVALLSLGILAGILGAPWGIMTRNRLLGATLQHTVISILFSGVLLLCLLMGTGSWKKLINNSALQFFGYISYGLYLIHLLIFRLYDYFCHRFAASLLPRSDHFGLIVVRFVIAGSAAVLLAYLSRVHFEERFLVLKDRFAATPTGPEDRLAESTASGVGRS
jgi:peptidoglycan/LPS O-acetylase OafA/YrhL